jgi:hypothetical protein
MSNLYVYLMRSRNKDNSDILDFKERTKAILAYRENEDSVIEAFKEFASKGVQGEQTRLYRSVNSRNEDKIREALIIRLLKYKPIITKLNRTLASVAQQAENRDESKWLFDFDEDTEELADCFIEDIKTLSDENYPTDQIEKHKTPNGYAIIVPRGLDTRKLLDKWADYDITLKKDEMLFLSMLTNK